MQEVEAAVREYYAAPITLFARDEQNEFVLRDNFSHRWRCGTNRMHCRQLRGILSYYHAAGRMTPRRRLRANFFDRIDANGIVGTAYRRSVLVPLGVEMFARRTPCWARFSDFNTENTEKNHGGHRDP